MIEKFQMIGWADPLPKIPPIGGFQTRYIFPENIKQYLPDFPIEMSSESKYPLKFRVDLLSSMLLSKYGGLFLSPSTLVMKSLDEIMYKLKFNYDLITFGGSERVINSCNNKNNPGNYIIAAKKQAVGDTVMSGENYPIRPGNCLPLKNIPLGTVIHNIELKIGKGAQMARSAGPRFPANSRKHPASRLYKAWQNGEQYPHVAQPDP